ncbi:MAG: hypothetical protein HC847_23290 [Hydrococcus sp. RU_2_2]|jgi:hypothetical protein|nr:hypothetical protein [Hydrococcus sp. RU_2_2]NJP18604.1 hypothetical protein [Hydrococcus sp. CRU_1_1]NJQ97440.1 hypothetical protein [Hydrococcus sp. CSU_1_8]
MQALPVKFSNPVSYNDSHLEEVHLDTLASSLAMTSDSPMLSQKRYQKILKRYLNVVNAVSLLNEQGQLILNQGFSNETTLSIVAGTLIYALERISLELTWQGDRIWLGSDLVLFRWKSDRYLYLQTQIPFKTRVDELLDFLKS